MPLSSSISLSVTVQEQINSYAGQFSVDPFIASALAQVVSGGNQFNSDNSTYVSNYGIGVMGISAVIGMSLGYDVTIMPENIAAGVEYLSNLLQQFIGSYPLALAAYLSSPGLVLASNGIPPLTNVQNAVYNVIQLAQLSGSTLVSIGGTLRSGTTMDPTEASALANVAMGGVGTNTTGTNYGSVSTQNTALLTQSLVPALQVDDAGLSEVAWYSTQGLITGNPKVRQRVQPVSFMVYLDRNNAQQTLRNPVTMQPIVLQLNCSMKSFEINSKHVFNRTPSRTGMHVTFWGMQPDLISGSGNTGVFMNAAGITDYFSTAGTGVNDSLGQMVGEAFKNSIDNEIAIGSNSEAYRVAAQDAFVELLKLFQMNGNVWYQTQNYQGVLTDQEQQSPNAWSSKVGASTFQQHSRNNDVMTRGFVAMKYRNNVYLGYFKSLSWTMDASKPFSWEFNFTFQVEKTYSALYWPNASATLNTTTPTLSA